MMTSAPLDVDAPPKRSDGRHSNPGRPPKANGKLNARVTAAISSTDFDRLCQEASSRRVSVSKLVRILLTRPIPKTPTK